ncbi:hypothetical protein BCJMU02_0358 [Bacillus cereus]|uniref:DCC1-like thiol-disulfide oxidoreductase family protein n=1 Tax=Bacillus cereus TaxID=1396 RepID=UPI001F29A010|nr:DCC1-like thiol-disulfide oxidoreductase family protein [Bacillus cereus]BCC45049.1 hypothetical protein BCJMU02_0358 [Bacillus cereus]
MGILIYDGECNVCSKFIMFIVKINKNPNLNITDFNSNWTKKNIELDVNIDSMIFIANNKNIYILIPLLNYYVVQIKCLCL